MPMTQDVETLPGARRERLIERHRVRGLSVAPPRRALSRSGRNSRFRIDSGNETLRRRPPLLTQIGLAGLRGAAPYGRFHAKSLLKKVERSGVSQFANYGRVCEAALQPFRLGFRKGLLPLNTN
jgi:hypothetical protein